MLTLIFTIMMLMVFGRLIGLAIRMSWGLTKVIFGLFFFPLLLIGAALGGLLYAALPILAITGIVSLFLPGSCA